MESKPEKSQHATIEDYFMEAVRYADEGEVGYCLENGVDAVKARDSNSNSCLRM